MVVTSVKIRKLFDADNPLKAIVSVVLDDCLAIHDIKVINARGRMFIVMPCRQNEDQSFRDIVHPINSEFRGQLEKKILEAFNAALIGLKPELEVHE